MARRVRDVLLIGTALLWLIPTYLVVVNASTAADDYAGPSWWPGSWGFFDNLSTAFETADIGQAMSNSLLYSTGAALIAVGVAALASFAVVIMPVKRPAVWFWAIYTGTLLPLQVFLSPLFNGYADTSLYDTQYGMVLIYAAIAVPFAFFVIRNYMTTAPREMMEAAQLDGASWIAMFVRIHLPLARGALLAAFLFQFLATWNDLLFGITLSTSPNVRPLMAALAELNGQYAGLGPPVILAAGLVASAPTVALFLGFQRFFVNALKLTP
ncbi:carbohydrate ABC transporter permease [Phytoactinopolyspora halotolerans]|uniref:Carbohydrate ABC transporter permease n=1 Tax=Phytoactinopolyspora halotolerans TaxID=1981512 RepID=A0A6L9SFP4_9ACTN|nr:carbohydrate ABC transporter permease [Phytoactinopolyspora halotolerans]NEE04205.1 carbohydrate ABC transporter permease [Phytoactinopolyspora halotolerans]